jgi:spore coat polysaccharide biosynthesis protein SpsF (cytidylyltransferase family)
MPFKKGKMRTIHIYIDTEEDYEAALKFVDDFWSIEKYVDIYTLRDWLDMVNAIEDYEDWHYPMGV